MKTKNKMIQMLLLLVILMTAVYEVQAVPNIIYNDETVTGLTNRGPGDQRILIQKIRIDNTGTSTATYPFLEYVDFQNIGTAPDNNISTTQLWYDLNGTWDDGDETLLASREFVSGNVSYGPPTDTLLQSCKIPAGTSVYVYLSVNLTTTVTDGATIKSRVNIQKMPWKIAGNGWSDLLQTLSSPGTTNMISVVSDRLQISGVPVNAVRGTPLDNDIIVQAVDQYGNVDKDFVGKVYFTSSDSDAVFTYNSPTQSYQFTSGDAGQKTFPKSVFVMNTTGSQNIEVYDATTGRTKATSAFFTVQRGLYHLDLIAMGADSLPLTVKAGQYWSQLGTGLTGIKANMLDNADLVYEDYNGTVYSYSTIEHSDNTFTASHTYVPATDKGSYVFSVDNIRLCKAGKQELVFKDTRYDYVGSWTVTVLPAAYAALQLTAPEQVNAKKEFEITLNATDSYGNILTDASSNLVITSNNPDFSAPSSAAFEEGKAVIKLTMGGLGKYELIIKDADNETITARAEIDVQMKMHKSMILGVTNNYLKPGSTDQNVGIFVNKQTDGDGEVTVRVYDTRGNLVYAFDPQKCVKGINMLKSWPARNSNNTPVASGVYIICIEGGGLETARRMVVVVR